MVKLHPNILEQNGEKAFVILSYEDFLLLGESLKDFEDMTILRATKLTNPTFPHCLSQRRAMNWASPN